MSTSIAALLVDASERFLGQVLGRLEAAGFAGLSVSHAFAIQLIEAGVDTITTLSETMRMTPQAVSAIASQLEGRGLVTRGRQAGDARAKILTLTDDGRRLAAEIARGLHDAEREWADLVGEERLNEVRATLAAYGSPGDDPTAAPARRRRRRVRVV